MPEWLDACAADAIESEGAVRFDHGGRTFAIYRNHENRYFCTEGLCPHEDVHLADGLVVEDTIECPKHFSVFDLATGVVQTPPACQNLRTFRTRVEAGRVQVEI